MNYTNCQNCNFQCQLTPLDLCDEITSLLVCMHCIPIMVKYQQRCQSHLVVGSIIVGRMLGFIHSLYCEVLRHVLISKFSISFLANVG